MTDPAAKPALTGYQRYAIYYAPPQGDPLSAFGEGWFGRAASGEARPAVALAAGDPDLAAASLEPLLASPRRYGLHATIKAPFALAPGMSPSALNDALAAYAARRPAATAPPLRLSAGLGFLALRPSGPSPALDALAAGVVAAFAAAGAPPSEEALAKRRAARLTRRQDAYLRAYGYPYVFEEFRFHVTLAGPTPPETARTLRAALEAETSPLRPVLQAERFAIDALCLFGDPGEGGAFRLLRRHELAPPR